MCYYIIKFYDNQEGNEIAFELSGVPNGTVFYADPIYINNGKNIWIIFPRSNDLIQIQTSIDYIKKSGGADIIKTDVKEKIPILNNITQKEYNQYINSIFSKYVPNLTLD